MVLGLAGTALAVPEEGERGVWIVTLHEEHDASTNARLVARSHGGDARFVYDDVLNGFSFHGSERGAANLERDPRVRTVVADQPVSIVAQTTPTGVSRIDARRDGADNDAHDAGHLGDEALVAILDTGIDLDHPDLQSNIVYGDDPQPSSGIGANCIDDSKHPDDGHGHGTHVAGTVAAVDNSDGVVGVAPSAGVVPVKVLDDNGSGSWESVICGVDHVTGLVASGTATIAAANMSLGGSGDASNCFDGGLRQAICESVQVDVVYTVAAGNDSDHSSNHVPAAYPEVMTISALADFDGLEGGDGGCRTYVGGGPPTEQCDDDLAFFSNYGLIVDVTAPGMDIYSTDTGASYSSKSGTSMAAPHVAGVVALVRSVDTTLTYDVVADLLKTTGECLYDNGRTWASADGTCTGDGWGPYDEDTETEPLVNALRASDNAGSTSNATPTADFTHSCTDLSCDFDASGSSDDSEGGIDGYSWRFDDSNAEQVGSASGQTTSFDFPASGDYLATLWVTDDDGALAETTATVSVSGSSGDGGGDDGSTTTGAHVESIGYDTWGGSDGSKHLGVTILIEDSNDQPLSGASVSIVLKLDSDNDGDYDDGSWSGTGTTDSDGTVRFELKNAPSGCYTTDVTDIDGSGDVSEPANETCK